VGIGFHVDYDCLYAFLLLSVLYEMLICYVNCLDAIKTEEMLLSSHYISLMMHFFAILQVFRYFPGCNPVSKITKE
jgi:hypothetical protein